MIVASASYVMLFVINQFPKSKLRPNQSFRPMLILLMTTYYNFSNDVEPRSTKKGIVPNVILKSVRFCKIQDVLHL